MRLLILGGTRFLGRHVAEQALAAGHTLTLLHRGRANAALFTQAEHLIADRNGDLGVLAGRTWDVVIDTSAYVPRHVTSVAARLAGRVGQYQLVSSVSAYAAMSGPGTHEDAPLARLDDPATEAVTGETYGGLKALCEEAARQAFGSAALVVRPGLIVGPHDPSGRFTWWVARFVRAGLEPDARDVLAPGDPAQPVQFIDARDLAAWMLRQAVGAAGGNRVTGAFNLAGPAQALSARAWLEACRAALAPAARLVWVDESFLLAEQVAPWVDLPLWLPAAEAGLHRADITRALASGLVCRPLAQTLRDTAAWAAHEPEATGLVAPPASALAGPPRTPPGLAPEREAELLRRWAGR